MSRLASAARPVAIPRGERHEVWIRSARIKRAQPPTLESRTVAMQLRVSSPSSGSSGGGGGDNANSQRDNHSGGGGGPAPSHPAPSTPSPVDARSAPQSCTPVFLEFRNISVQLKTRGRGAKPAPLQLAAAGVATAVRGGGAAGMAAAMPRAVELLPPTATPPLQPTPGLPSPPQFSFARPELTSSDQFPPRREAASAPAASGAGGGGGVGGGWADLPPASIRAGHRARMEGTSVAPAASASSVSAAEEKRANLEGAEELSRAHRSMGSGPNASPFSPALGEATPAVASSSPPPLAPAPAPAPPAKSFILNDVSGFALPGQLLVIMGASGSGECAGRCRAAGWLAKGTRRGQARA